MFLNIQNVSGKPLKLKVRVRHAAGSRIEAEDTEIVLGVDETIEVDRTANGFEIAAEDIPESAPAEPVEEEATEEEPPPNG